MSEHQGPIEAIWEIVDRVMERHGYPVKTAGASEKEEQHGETQKAQPELAKQGEVLSLHRQPGRLGIPHLGKVPLLAPRKGPRKAPRGPWRWFRRLLP